MHVFYKISIHKVKSESCDEEKCFSKMEKAQTQDQKIVNDVTIFATKINQILGTTLVMLVGLNLIIPHFLV